MRFHSALSLWMAGIATANPLVDDEDRSRSLRESVVDLVQKWVNKSRFLNGETNQSYSKDTTRVLWDGKRLHPIDQTRDVDSIESTVTTQGKDKRYHQTGRIGSRQARMRSGRRNKRIIKGAKESVTSSKKQDKLPKAVKSSLKVFRKRPKGSDGDNNGGSQEEILCFQGTSEEVTNACAKYNARCCERDRACAWDDYDDRKTTVCQGACRDKMSCYGIAPGSYISEYACVNSQACQDMARLSKEKNPVYVGPRSCKSAQDCRGICQNSETCKVEIGKDACIGTSSDTCLLMASQSRAVTKVYVGDNACYNFLACRYVAQENPQLEYVGIAAGSCNGPQACSDMGRKSTGKDILVLSDTCTGYLSCAILGYNTKEILAGSKACRGSHSCLRIGYYAENGIVNIGAESCSSSYSCTRVGLKTSEAVFISANACTDANACFQVASQVYDAKVSIGEFACSDFANQCSANDDPSCYTAANIPKYATSCRG